AGGNSPNGRSGENALYNYSAYGKSIKEIAQNIAFRSFKQWKNSPGHNRNMLRKGHVAHGTAFKITNDKVWGTDLFSSNNAPYDFNNSTPLYTKTKKKRSKRFSTFKTKRILTTQVLKELSIKIKKSKNSEAKKKVERLLSKRFKNKNGVLYSKKTAAKSRGIFKFFSKNKNTYALVIEKNVDDFDITTVTQQLITLIKENQSLNRKGKIDLSIALRKRKEVIRLTLVSIFYQPKSRLNVF
ncbi:MAG: hypothetical protein HRT73_13400, partial [Flavobacteriales bacterium]|nr:hypothetical protein [Flavobacteriales bacterium]